VVEGGIITVDKAFPAHRTSAAQFKQVYNNALYLQLTFSLCSFFG